MIRGVFVSNSNASMNLWMHITMNGISKKFFMIFKCFFRNKLILKFSKYKKFTRKGKPYFLTTALSYSYTKDDNENLRFISFNQISFCLSCISLIMNIPPDTIKNYTYAK